MQTSRRLVTTVAVATLIAATTQMPASATTVTVSVDTSSHLTKGHTTFQGFGIEDDTARLWSTANHAQDANMPADYTNIVGPRLAAMRPAIAREYVDTTWYAYNLPGSVMYDDATLSTDSPSQNGFTYAGTWTTDSGNSGAYFSSTTKSTTQTDRAAISCKTCTDLQWYSLEGPDRGTAYVQVDSDMPVLVNLYASTVTGSSVVFDSRPLAAGPHTLTITVGPPNAGGGKVIVDAVNEVGETPAISYTWDSPEMNGFVQDLSNLQATGTKIILTIGQISPWMTGTTGDINVGGTDGKPSAGYPTNVSDYSAWTSAITALLDYLASQSITNVIAVGAPNELVDLSDATQLNAGYTALSTVLTSGCQNGDQALCVQLFGPDFRRSDITTARGDTTLDSTLGFYDYHAYYSVGELNVGNFASDLTAIASHSTKPVWITEFGEDTGGTTGSSAWQSYAKFMIQGLDYGAAAMSLWNFQAIVFSGGGAPPDPFYSLVGPASGGYTPTFTYYAYSSVTAHTLANSTVFSTTCSNCTNVQMAVLRSSSGANAILVYNGNTTKWSATVDYGAPVSDTLYRYVINSSTVTSGNLIAYDKVIAPSGSTYAIGVPANSFAVFSSINPYSG